MTGPLALSAALLALYGIAHCAAMCGGFVASTFAAPAGSAGRRHPALAALAMHAGRLASYGLAGALAGALGATPAAFVGSASFHAILFSLGALALVVTGLRIAGVRVVAPAGTAFAQPLWRRATAAGAPDGRRRHVSRSGWGSGCCGAGRPAPWSTPRCRWRS